ncbi:MAG: 30S ribosome-binding factor RbfA [Cytophagales bacterium]|nr:MAG: 30S ribosome-binding factor RbfA [Cytophagales bacterium]
METTRQQKVARLLQKELADVFLQDARHLFGNAFITITAVRISPDLGMAKVYLSFLQDKGKDLLLEQIEEQTKTVRQMLAIRIKQQVRIIPELRFFLDDTEEYVSHINSLLDNLDIPKEEEEKKGENNEAEEKDA